MAMVDSAALQLAAPQAVDATHFIGAAQLAHQPQLTMHGLVAPGTVAHLPPQQLTQTPVAAQPAMTQPATVSAVTHAAGSPTQFLQLSPDQLSGQQMVTIGTQSYMVVMPGQQQAPVPSQDQIQLQQQLQQLQALQLSTAHVGGAPAPAPAATNGTPPAPGTGTGQAPGGEENGTATGRQVFGLQKGIVKKWNLEKGYGFIRPVEGGHDVFVHHTVVQAQGFRSLQEGSEVDFEAREIEPGRVKATRVTGPDGGFVKPARRPPNPPLTPGHPMLAGTESMPAPAIQPQPPVPQQDQQIAAAACGWQYTR